MTGRIRVGIGGWTFEPWRGAFYPPGTRQADELAYASRHVTAIEINSTYYSSQKPATFAKWAAQTPDGFVFAAKASRFCTNRRVLAEAGESIDRFFAQGIVELGDKLGPILWQFMATKRFDPDDFAAFLSLLPTQVGGLPLRHCVEVRNDSFLDPQFTAQCRRRSAAICLAHHENFPTIADLTADFTYARLMGATLAVETGYPAADLDSWAARLRTYAAGGVPGDLPVVEADRPVPKADRDVFAFFISGDKVRNPAAAAALIERLA
ncbi:MAG: DUF72 domain-containing protein [Caulobacteraceae bacterium]